MPDDDTKPLARAGRTATFSLAHLISWPTAKKAAARRAAAVPEHLKPAPGKKTDKTEDGTGDKTKRKRDPSRTEPPANGASKSDFSHLMQLPDAHAAAARSAARSAAAAARREEAAQPEPTFAEQAEVARRKASGETIPPAPQSFGARVLAAVRKAGRD